MNVLLLSTYELGHQPIGLARPAAHLLAAGHDVACVDLSVERLDERLAEGAEFVGISVPMHTAARLGTRLAERVRAINPRAHLSFYGLYASLNAESFFKRGADSVIGGEFETPLAMLVDSLAAGSSCLPAGVATPASSAEVFVGRQAFMLPARELLPPLERYARLDDGSSLKLAGYVEASRGCAHRCLHCPITPVYGGRLRIIARDLVTEDVRRLVAAGAEHITFGDPDFFNGVKHSCQILEAIHAEFPHLTYDVTIKVEHLLEHRALLPLLKTTGCAFVVSAVESIDDEVLGHLRKGHTAADVETALGLLAENDLVLRPTFVAFTPWTTLQGYLDLLSFVERHDLVYHVDPVQFAIRLLVPRGSSLIGTSALDGRLGPFGEETLTHRWEHPDPRVDALQLEVASAVQQAAQTEEHPLRTFDRIRQLALAAAGLPASSSEFDLSSVPSRRVARLTEPWFC